MGSSASCKWAQDDQDRRFSDLHNLVCDPATLLVAWRRVRTNRGSRSAGVDGETAYISWASQHRYLTLVTDHRRRRIVWGAQGHDSITADLFFAELGKQRCEQIEAISLDMGPGYAKSSRAHAPQAIIAIDPFHVAKAGSDALDEVRRGYWNKLRDIGDHDAARRFKGARWALLKNPAHHTDAQAATLRRLRAAGGEVWRAYTLKEALRAIFAPGLSLDDVELLLDRFISRARRSRLAAFVKLAATITKPRRGSSPP